MLDLVDNDPNDGAQIRNEKGHQPKVTNTSKIWNIFMFDQKNYKLVFGNSNLKISTQLRCAPVPVNGDFDIFQRAAIALGMKSTLFRYFTNI